MKSHRSKTTIIYVLITLLFCIHMKSHRSKTAEEPVTMPSEFCIHMKSHRSKTLVPSLYSEYLVLYPYEITSF